jgi:hypothetical protein
MYIRRYDEPSVEHHEKSLDDYFRDTPIPGQACLSSAARTGGTLAEFDNMPRKS